MSAQTLNVRIRKVVRRLEKMHKLCDECAAFLPGGSICSASITDVHVMISNALGVLERSKKGAK